MIMIKIYQMCFITYLKKNQGNLQIKHELFNVLVLKMLRCHFCGVMICLFLNLNLT